MMTRPGLYMHKGGDIYLVYGPVKDSTNAREATRETKKFVHYQSIKSLSDPATEKNIREEEEFHELVKWPDGQIRSRFCFLFPKISNGIIILTSINTKEKSARLEAIPVKIE